jgi:hypothetical protein
VPEFEFEIVDQRDVFYLEEAKHLFEPLASSRNL